MFEFDEGVPADVAPFVECRERDDSVLVLVWADARDIERVVVRWNDEPPVPEAVVVDYWHSQWPEQRPAADEYAGAGRSGWGHEGDWYNGDWKRADTRLARDSDRWTWTFAPLD